MRAWIFVSAALGLGVLLGPRSGRANPFSGLSLARPLTSTALAEHGFSGARTWSARAPMAMKRGLIDTGLLEAINHAKATPKGRDGGLDAKALATFGVARRGKRRYAFAGSKGRLRFALVRIPVPVDASKDGRGGWSPKRLHRLQGVLQELRAWNLRPSERDRYGNRFEWRGKALGGRVWVQYRPEQDEVWVLVHG